MADQKKITEKSPPTPGPRWNEDGEFIVPHLDDETWTLLMRLLPATAWNKITSIYDRAQFQGNEAEDVQDTRKLLRRIVKHPNFVAQLQLDSKVRQG